MYVMSDNAYDLLRKSVLEILDGCRSTTHAGVKDLFSKSPMFEVDCKDNPQYYYNFQFGRYRIAIIKYGTLGHYSIWSDRWKPSLDLVSPDDCITFGVYGSFKDLNDCINAFYLTCKNCMNKLLGQPQEALVQDLF